MDEVAAMENMRDLKETEGWHMLASFISGRVSYHKNQLMLCPLEDVPYHRMTVKALESIPQHVEEVIERGMEEMRQQPP